MAIVTGSDGKQFPRADRFTSHALVEIRKYKSLPFFAKSAVLLDISTGGFKMEFTGEHRVHPGQHIWMRIPLTPLGIYSPTSLTILGEVKWFDDKKYRVGGVYLTLTDNERIIIDQVIDSLRKRGFLL